MGTTSKRYTKCTHSQFDKKHLKDFLDDEYRDLQFAMIHFVPNNDDRHEVYAITRNSNGGNVFLMVSLIHIENGEIYWKDMTENEGPCFYNCAIELFKWINTENEYALEWRERCKEINKPLNRIV